MILVLPKLVVIPALLIGCAKTCFGGVVTARSVLASQQPLAHTNLKSPGGTGVTTRNGNDNQNEAIGQVVFSEALSGNEIDLKTLYLKTSQTRNEITIPSNGASELEIWLGVWSDDAPGESIYSETFDVVGITFENSTIYSFTFDNTFDI